MGSTAEGRRIHQMIAALGGEEVTLDELITRVHEMFLADPCGGTTQASSRIHCVTSVSVYNSRCRPSSGWKVTAAEMRLTHSTADLVYEQDDGSVVFDEVKTGWVDPSERGRIRDQLARLAVDGAEHFGDRFAGVRLVPIGAPARMALYQMDYGHLIQVPLLDGLEMRR